MSVSSSFAIQLLSKIGAPLAGAIEAGPSAGDETQSADHMAKMLGLAVEMSITLHSKLDVSEDEKQNENLADETRTALASIAAELIADFYKTYQKIPDNNDKDRMVKSLESVLGFADKFSSSKDQASRLKTLGRQDILFDETQSQLVVLQSIGAIVNAVIEFPFGQSETKLIQDISGSLQKDAEKLAKENGTADKLSELMIFKSLASLYAECHHAETKKVLSSNQEGTPSLEPVWSAYEVRMAMMNALVSGGDGDGDLVAGTGDTVAPTTQDTKPQDTPSGESPPPAEVPASAQPSAPVIAPAAAGGPMGFFAKKPAGEETSAPAEPETPPVEMPAPSPTEAPKEEPESEGPISQASIGEAPVSTQTEEKPKGEAGNPMSFFKAPPKTEE